MNFGQGLLKGLMIKEVQIGSGNNQMEEKNLSSEFFP